MKTKIYRFVLMLSSAFCALNSNAQAPNAIPYQAVARDNTGNVIANQLISLRFTIHNTTSGGPVVYQETQSANTNALGLFTVNVGQGTLIVGTFSTIDWGGGSKFMQVEFDPTGGSSYTNMGTQQMLSVPYALNAGNGYWTKSGNDIYNSNSGYVGVGGAPYTKFSVMNDFSLVASFSAKSPQSWIGFYNDTSRYCGYIGTWNSPANNSFDVGTGDVNYTGAFNLVTQATPRLTIDSAGNIGIGTIHPLKKFHAEEHSNTGILDDFSSFSFYANNLDWNNVIIAEGNDNGTATPSVAYSRGMLAGGQDIPDGSGFSNYGVWGHVYGTGAGGWGGIFSKGGVTSTSSEYVMLAGNYAGVFMGGNVGIGVLTPSEKLEVVGKTKTTNFQMTGGTPAIGKVLTATDALGNATWSAPAGITGTGTITVIPKWTSGSTLGNSLIQDNGTSISMGVFGPNNLYQLYTYRQQLTVNGDGQATVMGFRDRDTENDGTGYGIYQTNDGVTGYDYWGDLYTFGVHGASFGDYNRTGGVLGSVANAASWGILGYKNSASAYVGVYGSSAYVSGGGFLANTEKQGIGGAFFGGIVGSWSHGEIMGQVNSGELFASYNLGNQLTSGYSADLVNTGSKRVAAYSVTSPELKVYDNGSGQLNGTSVFVPFNESYAGMLSATPDVTVSPVGSPAQLYIQSIEKNGFTVAVANGTANVKFSWIAVGKRVDSENAKALPEEITSNNFDSQMNDVMFNDNNKEQSGKPIWWDGSRIRFDKAPEVKMPPKVEPKNK